MSKVVLFASGQSNWAGVATHQGTYPATTQYWNSGSYWSAMNPSAGYRNTSNPTISLAKEFERLFPDLRLYVIEDGEGGNGFASGFAPGNPIRTRIVNNFASGYTAARSLSGDVYFAGMTWNQGESDVGSSATASGYTASLNGFRAEIESATAPIPNWVSVRINDSLLGDAGGLAQIRLALQNYGSDFVDVDDIPLRSDNVHYEETGYTEIGLRQYTKIFAFPVADVDNTLPPPPVVYPTIDINMKGLSALPSGITSVSQNSTPPTFRTTDTLVARGGQTGWGRTYLMSNVLSWNVNFIIEYLGATNQYSVGVSNDPESWQTTSGTKTISTIRSGAVYRGISNIATVPATTNSTLYRTVFSSTQNGDVLVTRSTSSDGGTTFIQESQASITGGVALVDQPRLFIDSNLADAMVTRFATVNKT
jgi:hypothetical protein